MKAQKGLLVVLVVALALFSVLPVSAEPVTAVTWLKSQQQADGGFGSSGGSSLSETAEVVFALAAAGTDFSKVANSGVSVLDYLTANATDAATIAAKAKTALALIYAGGDASDLLSDIKASLSAEGMYGGADDSLTSHLYAMLALAAAGETVPAEAVTWLEDHQASNGGWSWNGSTAEADVDTNTTAVALEALAAAGAKSDAAVAAAVEYLRAMQNDDGGFPYQKPSIYGTDSDANSTALVIQALLAVGQDLTAWTAASGGTPLGALAAFQRNDGAFAWQAAYPDANMLATAQAVPALLGKAHPLVVLATEAEAVAEATVEATAEVIAEATTEATTAAEPSVTPTPAPVLLPTTGGNASGAPILMLAGFGLVVAGMLMRRRLAA